MKEEKHWTEKIYELVRKVPKGKVTTYGTLAEKVGTRTTSRMVGWAMNASHVATPRVPAHRVVNRNGLLTGKHHFGSPTLMEDLLKAEGIEVKNDQIVNFKKHLYTFEDEV